MDFIAKASDLAAAHFARSQSFTPLAIVAAGDLLYTAGPMGNACAERMAIRLARRAGHLTIQALALAYPPCKCQPILQPRPCILCRVTMVECADDGFLFHIVGGRSISLEELRRPSR